jgi:hypothetical protein
MQEIPDLSELAPQFNETAISTTTNIHIFSLPETVLHNDYIYARCQSIQNFEYYLLGSGPS